MILAERKIRVPKALHAEWREWSYQKRAQFIARMRELLGDDRARPDTPFSSNVIPFDYGTPEARAIIDRLNAGRTSRDAGVKINIVGQGVIWQDTLWFWSPKAGYLRSGGWSPEEGRPALHHVIWETAHGRTIPADHVVRFIDGNPNNLDPANLGLVTRNNVCRENQADALSRRSRERTAVLLNRAQSTDESSKTNIHQLRARHASKGLK